MKSDRDEGKAAVDQSILRQPPRMEYRAIRERIWSVSRKRDRPHASFSELLKKTDVYIIRADGIITAGERYAPPENNTKTRSLRRTTVNKRLILALSIACPLMIAGSAGANEIFDANCAACHQGGGNIMNPNKTLSKESLKKSGMDSVDAVKKRISEGKAPMPAFKGTLDDAQIADVAAFVIEQANKGW